METKITTTKQARRVFSRMGFGLFIIMALNILMEILLIYVNELMKAADIRFAGESVVYWAMLFLPLYPVAMPVGYVLMKTVPAATAEPQKLGGKQFWMYALMCVPLMYGGNLIGTWLSALLYGGQASSAIETLAMSSSVWKGVFLAVLAPICEEFIFRKQLIDRTVCYGEKTAVVFSALVFALFHMNVQQFFYALGLGWLFGYVYLKTRKLRYSTLLHVMINFLGTVVGPWVISLAEQRAEKIVTFEDFQASLFGLLPIYFYSILLIGLAVAGLVVLIIYRKRFTYQPAELEVPKGSRFKAAYCNPGVIAFTLLSLAVVALQSAYMLLE